MKRRALRNAAPLRDPLFPGAPIRTGNRADLLAIDGMPGASALGRILATEPSFPILTRGGYGKEFMFDLDAAADWIRTNWRDTRGGKPTKATRDEPSTPSPKETKSMLDDEALGERNREMIRTLNRSATAQFVAIGVERADIAIAAAWSAHERAAELVGDQIEAVEYMRTALDLMERQLLASLPAR